MNRNVSHLSRLIRVSTILILAFYGSLGEAASTCARAFFLPVSFEELMAQTERPEITEVARLKAGDAQVVRSRNARDNEEELFRFFHSAAREIIDLSKDKKVLILARDGELIYDAIQLYLEALPEGQNRSSQFQLVNLSRPLVRNSSKTQLFNFLRAHGVEPNAVIRGEQKVLIVDTGYRGSILLKVIENILSEISFSQPQTAIKRQIKNVLRGVEGRLIVSESAESTKELLKQIDETNWNSVQEVQSLIRSRLYFAEYMTEHRAEHNVPDERIARHRWVVNNIEHVPHFNGRASSLNSAGTRVESYEANYVGHKEDSVAEQLRLIDHIRREATQHREEVRAELREGWTGERKKLETVDLNGIREGELIEMPSGMLLKFVAQGGIGRRGHVLKVVNEANELFALKVAKDERPETIESFADEIEKADGAQSAGFRVPRILESGVKFHLKEWAEGKLAVDWIAEWKAAGYPRNDPALIAIKRTLREAALRGRYTGDLNRKNLIWNGEWVVIDSGSTRSMSQAETRTKYLENISSRWTKEAGAEAARQFRAALEE